MAIVSSLRLACGAALIAGFVLARHAVATDRHNCAEPQSVVDPKYSPGQVWSYKTRPGESSSTVTILRVENLPKVGVIVHVRIDGVRFKNCTGGPAPTSVEHAPFTKASIDESVIRELRATSRLPEFEAGYKDWLAHCGGVYTITLADMVEADDATFNAGPGLPEVAY
jgi:hypothetical protein